MGYLIKKVVQQIVTAKITLTSANLLTPGYIVDIPEYPAIPDYYWQVLSMNGLLSNGTVGYVGASSVHIQASTAIDLQFRFPASFIGNIGSWGFGTISTNIPNPKQFVDNDNLQIHNPGTLTVGDSDLILYITAILIRL
jgi:hypothetical protein